MSWYAWVLTVGMAAAAVTTWYAVWRSDKELERMFKPSFMVLLIALTLLLGADRGHSVTLLVVGLAFSLVGDVLLLDHRRFVGGLVAFLLAHLAYIAAVLQRPVSGPPFPWLGFGAIALALACHGRFGRDLIRAAGSLRIPVLAYEIVLLSLCVLSWFRGPWLLGFGTSFFVASDLMLGRDHFLGGPSWSRIAVMSTYHVAQVLIVWGLLA